MGPEDRQGDAAKEGDEAHIEEEAPDKEMNAGNAGENVELPESRKPRICRRPMGPTKQEKEEHDRSLVEYRSWCPHCVAGKSISMQHRQGNPEEEKLGVTTSID